MSEGDADPLAIALVSEVLAVEGMIRSRLSRALPKGMELSHFVVLNHLYLSPRERSPIQLAHLSNVTKGAMTNTLNKLEVLGYVHIRPDWDDGRRKWVSLSDRGRNVREDAVRAIAPIFEGLLSALGQERIRSALPLFRDLRRALD